VGGACSRHGEMKSMQKHNKLYKILARKPEWKRPLERVDVNERIILKLFIRRPTEKESND
jgi:hypothetical protein